MRKYTSAARMPFWKWFLCLIGGLVLFFLLYGLAEWAIPAITNEWLQMVVCLGIGSIALFIYAVWIEYCKEVFDYFFVSLPPICVNAL